MWQLATVRDAKIASWRFFRTEQEARSAVAREPE